MQSLQGQSILRNFKDNFHERSNGGILVNSVEQGEECIQQLLPNLNILLAPSQNYHSARRCKPSFELKPNEMTVPSTSTVAATTFSTDRVV